VYPVCLFIMLHTINLLRLRMVKGLCSLWERVFLYEIPRTIPLKGDILEIGSYGGKSSAAIVAGNESSRTKGIVWLVEPFPQPSKETFLNNFYIQRLNKHIRLVDKTSEEARKLIDTQFKFIFIDGKHDYEYVKKDILLWQDLLKEGGIIAFHDRYFEGVSKATKELIINSGKYTSTGSVDSIFYAVKKGTSTTYNILYRLELVKKICKKLVSIIDRKKV